MSLILPKRLKQARRRRLDIKPTKITAKSHRGYARWIRVRGEVDLAFLARMARLGVRVLREDADA